MYDPFVSTCFILIQLLHLLPKFKFVEVNNNVIDIHNVCVYVYVCVHICLKGDLYFELSSFSDKEIYHLLLDPSGKE